jgi:hypothetical protein
MLSLICLIAFPFLFWSTWKTIQKAKASAQWPGVPGTVTASAMKKRAWQNVSEVLYSYRVEGRDYTGKNVNFTPGLRGKAGQDLVQRYPVGAAVTVYHAPRDAAVSVLEPGPNPYLYAILRMYVVLFLMLVGVNVALYFVDKLKPANDADETPAKTYDDTAAADPGLGDRLLKEGADRGDAKDEGYVGTWYLGGLEGYPKDPVQAAIWFRKSAEQGDAGSQNMLGMLYAEGKGVPKDMTQAVNWFQKAAAQGEPHACVWLGRAYEKGVGGLPKDTAQAIEWYKKAGDEPHAKEFLKRLGAE